MFVEIKNFDTSPIAVDVELKKFRKEYGHIQALDAIVLLKKTNHTANIRFIIKEINKLSKEDRWYFKSFVLSAIDGREHTESVYEALIALAVEQGYLDEFLKADSTKKIYNPHDCKFYFVKNDMLLLREYINEGKRCVAKFTGIPCVLYFMDMDLKNVAKLELGYNNVTFERVVNIPPYLDLTPCFRVGFVKCDLSQFDNLMFREGSVVKFDSAYNFPDNLDVFCCQTISFENCDISNLNDIRISNKGKFYKTILPKAIYLYPKAKVVFDECDFSGVNEMGYASQLTNVSNIDFVNCCNLPKVLDLSKCDHFSFKDTDLAGVKKIKFKQGSRIDLSGAYNFPEVMSFPPLNYLQDVCLSSCDLKGVKELHFSEKTSVEIRNSKNLPEDLDLSNCYRVDLTGSDLAGVKDIKFREEATIIMREAKNVPTCLDFSMCDEVYVDEASLLGVKSIRFANKEQKDKVLKRINYKGRVVFNSRLSNFLNDLSALI